MYSAGGTGTVVAPCGGALGGGPVLAMAVPCTTRFDATTIELEEEDEDEEECVEEEEEAADDADEAADACCW